MPAPCHHKWLFRSLALEFGGTNLALGSAGYTMSRPISRVVAVSGDPHRAELLDALLADEHDYDVVVVESIARGYSRTKQIAPDVIVVFHEIDDVAACQLLSMLTIDREMSGIPVVTCATRPKHIELEEIVAELTGDSPCVTHAIQMN